MSRIVLHIYVHNIRFGHMELLKILMQLSESQDAAREFEQAYYDLGLDEDDDEDDEGYGEDLYKERQLIKRVVTHNASNVPANILTYAVERLMMNRELVYTGVLYRGVVFKHSDFLKYQTPSQLLHAINTYANTKHGAHAYQSWTPALSSAIWTVGENMDDDDIIVVLTQHGTGLHVPKAIGYDFLDEDEVLTKDRGNIQIQCFCAFDEKGKLPQVPVDDMQNLQTRLTGK